MTTKTGLREAIDEFCVDNWPDEEILLFGSVAGDPYDEGFLGVGYQQHKGPVAVYDRDKCIDALAREFATEARYFGNTDDSPGDPYVDAVEWFDFNTAGAWIGEQTPIVIARFQASK